MHFIAFGVGQNGIVRVAAKDAKCGLAPFAGADHPIEFEARRSDTEGAASGGSESEAAGSESESLEAAAAGSEGLEGGNGGYD